MPRLPQKPPKWLEQLSAFLADEKGSKNGVDLRVVKRHWSEFIDKVNGPDAPKKDPPKPEETLGRAIGRLTKRAREEIDLEAVEAAIRSNAPEPQPLLARSISSALSEAGASDEVEQCYTTFKQLAEEHRVPNEVRKPVTQMYNSLSSIISTP